MKKMLIIVIHFIVIIGCSRVEINQKNASIDASPIPKSIETNTEAEVSTNTCENTINQGKYYGAYQMDPEDEFDNLIKNNPIDKDYDKEFDEFQRSSSFTTGGWIELEEKYIQIWTQEMNETLSKLKSKLTKEEYDVLEESQKGWLQYNDKESGFVINTFLLNRHFGTQGDVMAENAIMERIRERTIVLLEYLYELNDYKIDFLYKGN